MPLDLGTLVSRGGAAIFAFEIHRGVIGDGSEPPELGRLQQRTTPVA